MKSKFAAILALQLLLIGLSVPSGGAEQDDKYDRLDGTGASGIKVNVIEWGENLEVHVYPAHSTQSLSFKLDKKNKDKPVMVIGYRFKNAPETQLIRRAILGIPFNESFKVYQEAKNDEYDKFVVTLQPKSELGETYAAYAPEAPSNQLYPDGHPALKAAAETPEASRKPAKTQVKEQVTDPDSDGSIGHFF